MGDNLAYQYEDVISAGYADEYISDIPWDKNPAFMFSNDVKGYLEGLRNVLEVLPIGGQKINYHDEVWDFNAYLEDSNSQSNTVSFKGCPDEIIDYEKFFVLHSIMGAKKVSTAKTRYEYSKGVINQILSDGCHTSFYAISTQDIVNAVEGRQITPSTAHQKYVSTLQFYTFLKYNYRLELNVDLDRLYELSINSKRAIDKEGSKFPNIPDEYFAAIRRTVISIMRDDSSEYNERVTACEIVLLMELGMRINDLTALTTDCLKQKKLSKSGHYVKYIHYKAKKPTKAHQPLLQFDIFCTELCAEAFEVLKEIRKESPYSKGNNYLFILNPANKGKERLPHSSLMFRRYYCSLIERYLPDECTHPWDDAIAPHKAQLKSTGSDVVYIPTTPQYRVHLCSTLYNEKHVSLTWIQRYMGHLSEYMLGYYVRPADTYQENIKFSEETIKKIVKDKIRPLGGDGNGDEIAERIRNYIENGKFNVETDMDSIMASVEDRVIIRGKSGGVCIKTSLMKCEYDARSNKTMCAYNMCPNLFHFYYMIDISYGNFKNLQNTYQAALDRGQIKAAQKELYKCKMAISNRLKPEMEELEAVIAKQGINAIVEQYPSLLEIIDKRDIIKKEYESWMLMKTPE